MSHISPLRYVEKNLSCREISDSFTGHMWRNLKILHICHMCDSVHTINSLYCVQFIVFCRILRSFVAKSDCLAIHALLLQNLFCLDLLAFAWRRIESQIVAVDKNDKYLV